MQRAVFSPGRRRGVTPQRRQRAAAAAAVILALGTGATVVVVATSPSDDTVATTQTTDGPTPFPSELPGPSVNLPTAPSSGPPSGSTEAAKPDERAAEGEATPTDAAPPAGPVGRVPTDVPGPPISAGPEYPRINFPPKISQASRRPGDALNAGSPASALMLPVDRSRTLSVQRRRSGSSEAWETIASAKPNAGGYVPFTGAAMYEYRALLARTATAPQVVGRISRYAWQEAFADDFSGTSLSSRWTVRRPGYSEKQLYGSGSMDACSVSGGVLHVKAIIDRSKPVGKDGFHHFKNCHVGTESSFTQVGGWWSARVKFHRYPGSHASFWTQSVNGYVPGAAEVDIAENFGSQNPNAAAGSKQMYNTYYDWTNDGRSNIQGTKNAVNDVQLFGAASGHRWWNSYHVYTMRWTPGKSYEFYIDGRKLRTVTNNVGSSSSYPVLSMLTGNWEHARMERNISKMSTYSMDVDWVRVWR